MAIVDPMSDVFTPLLSTSATPVVIPSTTMSDLELGFEALLPTSSATRTTEPLGGTVPLLDEVADVSEDDIDLVEEGVSTDVLEGIPVHSRHVRATATRQALGSEDAFQRYLR